MRETTPGEILTSTNRGKVVNAAIPEGADAPFSSARASAGEARIDRAASSAMTRAIPGKPGETGAAPGQCPSPGSVRRGARRKTAATVR